MVQLWSSSTTKSYNYAKLTIQEIWCRIKGDEESDNDHNYGFVGLQ